MKRPDERGFALLSVIFALLVLSLLATAGMFTATQESRIAEAGQNADDALYIAENGVARVLAKWEEPALDTLSEWQTTTITGTVPDEGVWEVDVLRVSDRIYQVQGRGQVYRNGQLEAGVSRSVGITAAKLELALDPPAALTTRGPTTIKGTAEVHGEDEVPPGWTSYCDPASNDKPGIMNDDQDNVSTTGQGEITGTPEVAEDPTMDDETFQQFGDDMDWEALTDMATITLPPGNLNTVGPDSTAQGGCVTSNELNWGNPQNPLGACGGYFPIIHATGSYLRLQGGGVGQGILLVDGDLDLRGDFLFHGIVIVQGSFETQGSGNRVRGAVMAGNTYFEDQSVTGGSVVGYSDCSVERAIEESAELRKPRMLAARAWSDMSRSHP